MGEKICAIVGAGEGLGRALAGKFAAQGYDLALLSHRPEGCEAALAAARSCRPGGRADYFAADATVPETLETALSGVVERWGAIDLLIYNVRGSFTACEPLEMTYADLEETFKLEVVGAFAAAKAVLPAMLERGAGKIFFSSATAAFRGSPRHPLYAIGKFGLRALSQSLAKAYGKDGVQVVHFRLDCDLDVPIMHKIYGERGDVAGLADPNAVAEAYWLTSLQPQSAWSNEVELRPHHEAWTI